MRLCSGLLAAALSLAVAAAAGPGECEQPSISVGADGTTHFLGAVVVGSHEHPQGLTHDLTVAGPAALTGCLRVGGAVGVRTDVPTDGTGLAVVGATRVEGESLVHGSVSVTDGTTTVVMDEASHSVGINKASPAASLDVVGDAHVRGTGTLQADEPLNGHSDLRVADSITVVGDGHTASVINVTASSVCDQGTIATDVETGRLVVDETLVLAGGQANVGIGTGTPTAQLHVAGTTAFTGDISVASNTTVGESVAVGGQLLGHQSLDTGSLQSLSSTVTATLTVAGSLDVADRVSLAANTLAVEQSTSGVGVSMWTVPDPSLALHVNGTMRVMNGSIDVTGELAVSDDVTVEGNMTVTGPAVTAVRMAVDGDDALLHVDAGRVGIRTATPAAALHVNGSALVAGTIHAMDLTVTDALTVHDEVTLNTLTSVTGAAPRIDVTSELISTSFVAVTTVTGTTMDVLHNMTVLGSMLSVEGVGTPNVGIGQGPGASALVVNGTFSTAGSATIDGDLDVTGGVGIGGDVTVDGSASFLSGTVNSSAWGHFNTLVVDSLLVTTEMNVTTLHARDSLVVDSDVLCVNAGTGRVGVNTVGCTSTEMLEIGRGDVRVSDRYETARGHDLDLPLGSIIMYVNDNNTWPDNWQVADGTNGCPDLRDRLVVSAGPTFPANTSGGAATHSHTSYVEPTALTLDQIPKHRHNIAHGHTRTVVPSQSHTHNQINYNEVNEFDVGTNVEGKRMLESSKVIKTQRTPSILSGFDQYTSWYVNTANVTGGGQGHDHELLNAPVSNLPSSIAVYYLCKIA